VRLTWDEKPEFETGLSHGVFYSPNGLGEVWDGLSSVLENEDSTEQSAYLDGIKIGNNRKSGYLSGTIEAIRYPLGFFENILMQRRPRSFGMSYRVETEESYKLHVFYNASISPTTIDRKQYGSEMFSWDFSTKPTVILDNIRGSHLVIDVSIAYPETVLALENVLYGSDAIEAHLPTPLELLTIFEENSIVRVIDNGDGSFTVIGPDSAVSMLDATSFEITWPTAVFIDSESYTIHSL
jgi:hypothetical protein